MDVQEALANAQRLLENAEKDTNLATMEALTRLAESWVAIANSLTDAKRD